MDPMKKAWDILKADTRPDIRNEAQYEAASLIERKRWHNRQRAAYQKRLNALRTQHTVDLTDVENPVYQEMKNYQEVRNFHGRQEQRLKQCLELGKKECNDFYSPELEASNRRKIKLKTTPSGILDPYVELSLDVYNNLTNEQKANYHDSMGRNVKDKAFHIRMTNRLRRNSALPTFPSPKYGGESSLGKEYTKEEYLDMDEQEKIKYHAMMRTRFRRTNNPELSKFHSKMEYRLKRKNNSPTYFSPEHEQEEQ